VQSRLLVAAGNFFFKVRNGLFPVVFVALLVLTRPTVLLGSASANALLLALGAGLALLGEFVRCVTIGYEYIERGGRDGKVYASFLVKGGVYSHTRNPMYVGNALIAIGLMLYSGAPLAILAGIPFFLFVYLSITAAEEHYLAGRFGDDYQAYCRRVNRFFPPVAALFRTLSSMTYDGRKALRKEYGTLWVVGTGLIVLPWWRSYHLAGAPAARESAPVHLGMLGLLTAAYVTVLVLKKTKRLG
jgi:protein-S-isoprenylcysteine O-methyltransferase Ste14